MGTPLLFGRREERSLIESAFEDCLAQRRCHRLILVAEPGLGKSLLAYEALEGLRDRTRVAIARCQPSGYGSLAPLETVLSQLVPGLAEDPIVAINRIVSTAEDADVVAKQVCRLFGWGDTSEADDVSTWSVRRLLEILAKDQPIAILVDDLHWAAEAIIDAIEDFATRLEGPVLLLSGTRPELLNRRPGLAYESPTSRLVRLTPFNDPKAIELVEALLGGSVERSKSLQELIKAAQGNPLFLTEAVTHMRETAQMIQEGDGWKVSGGEVPLSPTIEALLAARITSLPSDERQVVDAAAIWMSDFQVDEIDALIPSAEQSGILGSLARLQMKNIVEGVGPTRFDLRHALIRDAAYQLSAEEERVNLHVAAAEHAKRSEMPDALIGYHLEQAFLQKKALTPDDPSVTALGLEAAAHLASAGEQERIRGASAAALDFFARTRALRPVGDTEWVSTSIEAAECAKDIGRQEAAREISEEISGALSKIDDPLTKARADLLSVWLQIDSPDPALEKQLRDLLPVFDAAQDDVALVRLFRALGEWHWFNGLCGPASDHYERALEHALRTPERRDLGQLVASIAKAALWGPMPISEGVDLCRRLLEVASDDPFPCAQVQWRWASLDALTGDFQSAQDRIETSRTSLAEIGQDMVLAISTQEAGMIALLAGDLPVAHDEFKLGFDELSRLGEVEYRATNAALVGRALYEQGHDEEALKYLDIAEETVEEDPAVKQDSYPVRAQVAADEGDAEAARAFIAGAREASYDTDALTVQAHVEVQAVRTFRKLGSDLELRKALLRAEALCNQKEAPALLALADLTA